MIYGAAGNVSLAGPVVSSTTAYRSLDSSANALFLTQVTFNQSGVLFAFIVHCVNLSPVRLQVWRPTNITTSYTLVCQHRVVPTVEDLRRRVVVSELLFSQNWTRDKCLQTLHSSCFVDCQATKRLSNLSVWFASTFIVLFNLDVPNQRVRLLEWWTFLILKRL